MPDKSKKPTPTPTPNFGEFTRRTPEELDALSQPTTADLIAAKELWETNAPAPLRELLNAEPEEPDA